MKLNKKILVTMVLSIFSQFSYAIPFSFEGRSLGMGGVNVATANLATAAWANPAMLTNQQTSDDFALLIGVGAYLRDNDDLVTDIDDYQAADDRRQSAIDTGDVTGEAQALVDMSAIISGIDGKVLSPELTGLVAMGISSDLLSFAVSIRGDVIAGGTVTDLSCSPTNDPTCDLVRLEDELTSTNFNILNVEGVLATEIGFSVAGDFKLLNRKVSLGVKPKVVDLQAFTFSESILTVSSDRDNLDRGDTKTDLGTFTTVDLGAAVELSDTVRLGLSVRNLITDEFELGGQTLNFETEARVGLAYHNDFLTLAVDYDLIENEPLLANPAFEQLKTQYLAVGAEFNAFDFAQLRIGAAKNVANGISDAAKDTALTAGVGLWLGFNLDIAATFTDNSFGAFLQTGFRF